MADDALLSSKEKLPHATWPPAPKEQTIPVRTAQHLTYLRQTHSQKRQIVAFASPSMAGAYEGKASREATQGKTHSTDRTKAAPGAFLGMRIPLATPPSMAFGLPPAFLARRESRSGRCFRSFLISLSSPAYSPAPVTYCGDEVNNQSYVRYNK